MRRWIKFGVACIALVGSACGSAPTVIDSGVYGGAWTVVEWRGTLVELSTDASCTSKRACSVSVCVTVAGGERVCRESAGEVRPPGLRAGEGSE